MLNATKILAVLLAQPSYVADRDESPAAREELLRPVAEAIAEAAHNNQEAAMLIALGQAESGFARYVVTGHCSEGPAGARCDSLHGIPRARGAWQLHKSACPTAWALVDGSEESIRAEAQCAVRHLRYFAARGREHALTPTVAAFAGYAARSWSWAGAEKRAETTKTILAALRRTP